MAKLDIKQKDDDLELLRRQIRVKPHMPPHQGTRDRDKDLDVSGITSNTSKRDSHYVQSGGLDDSDATRALKDSNGLLIDSVETSKLQGDRRKQGLLD